MKWIMLTLSMLCYSVVGVMGQASAIHDESIMQQYMVAENGKGMLTPQYYYQAFHRGYYQSDYKKSKKYYRDLMKGYTYAENIVADSVRNGLTRMSKAMAATVLDRQATVDPVWAAERLAIEPKLETMMNNIGMIIPYGGSRSLYDDWLSRYNMVQTALTASRDAYMPSSMRKRQYMAIGQDLEKYNRELAKILKALSLSGNPLANDSTAMLRKVNVFTCAARAMAGWKMAIKN